MKKIKPEGPEREDNLSPVTLPVTGHCYLSPLLIQYYRRARAIYILSSPPHCSLRIRRMPRIFSGNIFGYIAESMTTQGRESQNP